VLFFNAKPEDILADDDMVDRFSPRDVRSLTYLGYLGINSPQYSLLAKRLSENDDKLIFAIRKKGEAEVLIKSAHEITPEILSQLPPTDAHTIGYVSASEHILKEEKEKQALKKMRLTQQEKRDES